MQIIYLYYLEFRKLFHMCVACEVFSMICHPNLGLRWLRWRITLICLGCMRKVPEMAMHACWVNIHALPDGYSQVIEQVSLHWFIPRK